MELGAGAQSFYPQLIRLLGYAVSVSMCNCLVNFLSVLCVCAEIELSVAVLATPSDGVEPFTPILAARKDVGTPQFALEILVDIWHSKVCTRKLG